jgi:hypothetical protein
LILYKAKFKNLKRRELTGSWKRKRGYKNYRCNVIRKSQTLNSSIKHWSKRRLLGLTPSRTNYKLRKLRGKMQ